MSKPASRRFGVTFLALVLSFAALWPAAARADAAVHVSPPARAANAMVAAADGRAVKAALDVLKADGGAVDAAIAAQLVLGLVEPQSSGIGGGGFILYFDAASGTIESYDGRERAPAAAAPDQFLAPRERSRLRDDFATGGLSVGVPGIVRLLALIHEGHGRLPWARLLEPAIRLAEDGFLISPRLAEAITETEGLDAFEETRAYFFDADGKPRQAGERLANPAYAETLRVLANEGADAFYEGPLAADIAATVQGASINPGGMTERDLALYQALRRPPLCATYRAHLVCGMGPPSSGGPTVLQTLKLLERFDLAALAPDSVEAVHLVSEASRLAFADRNRYLADADHVPVPLDGLLDPDYIAARATLIDPARSIGVAPPGDPPGSGMLAEAAIAAPEGSSTSHLVIADAAGNVVSFTTSIERPFGSYLMTGGFLLNSELTDFSLFPREDGALVANRVEPGKRPRSSMAPTLIFTPSGAFGCALGAPGSSRIIGYVLETVLGLIDWKLDIQAAIDLPRYLNRNGPTELEGGTSLPTLAPALEALGHEVRTPKFASGLQGVCRVAERLEGGADPRREGVARGY
ncbi:MAG: gamma-glutamyltransferase [Alphaproteobacteria bacterium]